MSPTAQEPGEDPTMAGETIEVTATSLPVSKSGSSGSEDASAAEEGFMVRRQTYVRKSMMYERGRRIKGGVADDVLCLCHPVWVKGMNLCLCVSINTSINNELTEKPIFTLTLSIL